MTKDRLMTSNTVAPLAALCALLIGGTLGSTAALADEAVVAYAAPAAADRVAARAAIDEAISGAAERANAALTDDLRMALEDRVRSKLRLASAATTSRG